MLNTSTNSVQLLSSVGFTPMIRLTKFADRDNETTYAALTRYEDTRIQARVLQSRLL